MNRRQRFAFLWRLNSVTKVPSYVISVKSRPKFLICRQTFCYESVTVRRSKQFWPFPSASLSPASIQLLIAEFVLFALQSTQKEGLQNWLKRTWVGKKLFIHKIIFALQHKNGTIRTFCPSRLFLLVLWRWDVFRKQARLNQRKVRRSTNLHA